MGCDIHSTAEKEVDGKWQVIDGIEPFAWRSYALFGFLANVRNYSAVTPISEARGLPSDAANSDPYAYGDHSYSWLSVKELVDFDYDQMTEDRRYSGASKSMTYRDFLGESFFEELSRIEASGAGRIVFGFDS